MLRRKKQYSFVTPTKSLGSKEDQQNDIFVKFKDMLKSKLRHDEFMHQDHYLKKWLIARDWNIDKAVEMFNNAYSFRKKRGLDSLRTKYTPPEVLQIFKPGGICGWDRDGSPVLYELHGYIDIKGVLFAAKLHDIENTKLLQCEETVQIWREESEKRGHIVDGITMVLDCEKVGTQFLWRPGMNVMIGMTELLEDNYPEMVKKMIVVNAPAIFPVLYNICRPALSDAMKQKIVVLGKNFKEQLLEYIAPEELPAYLGGEKTDPDGNPRCTTWINQGGVIPESMYLNELLKTEGLKKLDVPSSSQKSLKFFVDTIGCFLQWEFVTEGYDIAYRIEFSEKETENGSREVLQDSKRVNSHLVPEDGSYQCQKMGYYYLVLDNSFSWARGKRVLYSANIVQNLDNTAHQELNQMMNG